MLMVCVCSRVHSYMPTWRGHVCKQQPVTSAAAITHAATVCPLQARCAVLVLATERAPPLMCRFPVILATRPRSWCLMLS